MSAITEARRLRIRGTTLADDMKRHLQGVSGGSPCLMARTVVLSSYPSVVPSYFACQPLAVLGAEIEGGQGAVSAISSTFFALNLGSTIPPVGTQVLVTFVGNRWAFRYDS